MLRTKMKRQVMLPGKKRQLDSEILALLQEDCRLSYAKIAHRLDIAVGTAFSRIKKLEKKGFIKKYSAVLDSTKLGYELTTIILIQTEGSSDEVIKKELYNSPNVLGMYDITGDYDLAIIGKFRNRTLLNSFIKKILSTPNIKRATTNVALKVIKEDFGIEF